MVDLDLDVARRQRDPADTNQIYTGDFGVKGGVTVPVQSGDIGRVRAECNFVDLRQQRKIKGKTFDRHPNGSPGIYRCGRCPRRNIQFKIRSTNTNKCVYVTTADLRYSKILAGGIGRSGNNQSLGERHITREEHILINGDNGEAGYLKYLC